MSIIQGLIGSVQGGGAPPTFTVNSYDHPVSEGSYGYVNYSYTNQPNRTLYWTLSNASTNSADFTGDTSGSFNVSGNGDSSFSYLVTADLLTEGDEYFYIYIGTSPGDTDIWTTTVHVTDSSTTPIYGWSPLSGSMAFNGSVGHYVSYNSTALAAGTGEFAFEGLFYIKSTNNGGNSAGTNFLLGNGDSNTWTDPNGINIWTESNRLYINMGGTMVNDHGVSPTFDLYDQWVRIAIARVSGGYVKIFINGVNQGATNTPMTANLTQTTFDLGTQRRYVEQFAPTYFFNGYMTNIHWNTDATYVNNKFNTGGNRVDELTTLVTATTGTQLLLNATTSATVTTDSSTNAIPAILVTGGPSWSRKTSYLAPQLWLDGNYTESYSGSGSRWMDLGSTGKGATLYNTSFDNTYKALVFDSRVTAFGQGPNLGQDSFNTVAMWVKAQNFGGGTWPPTGPNSPAIFTEAYPGSTSKIAFAVGPNLTFDTSNTHKITAGNYSGAWFYTSPAYPTVVDTWYHIVLTQGDDGNSLNPSMKMYVNGQLYGTGASNQIFSSGDVYRIARRWDGGEYFPGSIGVVQKYNQALTASQVLALYNVDKERFLPSTASFTISGGGNVVEGSTATFSVTTANVDDGTTLYWWRSAGTATADDVPAVSGSFTVTSNAGSFTITPTQDYFTESTETLTISIGLVNGGTALYSGTLNIVNNSATPPGLVALVTSNITTSAGDGKVWPTYDVSDVNHGSMVHGSWTRNGDYTTGGVNFTSDTWIEVPTNVNTNTFSMSLVADFTVNSGWNSIFSTGDLVDGGSGNGTGYHCWYITGSGDNGTISIVTNYNSSPKISSFACTQTDYAARAHWAFVIDTSGGSDATQIYRNGVALTKSTSALETPASYGSLSLVVGARRQGGSYGYDTTSGTIYRIFVVPLAWSQLQAQTDYNNIKTTYDI